MLNPCTLGWDASRPHHVSRPNEDAVLRRHDERGTMLAVADGCGGSGARLLHGVTHARWAARQVLLVMNDQQTRQALLRGEVEPLEVALRQRFARLMDLASRDANGPRMRGPLLKNFPTTLALAVVPPRADPDAPLPVTVVWAGDSRVYAMPPGGPAQLWTEDQVDPDFEGDAPMTNCLHAGSVRLACRIVELAPPWTGTLLMAATDGTWTALRPGALPRILVRGLLESADLDTWRMAVMDGLSSVAYDDHSLAVGILGSPPWNDLQHHHLERQP